MLLELPIELINKDEEKIVGEENATTKPGLMTICIDCIQNIHEIGDKDNCILVTNDGDSYMILLPYDYMKRIWHKALDTRNGLFLLNAIPETTSDDKSKVKSIKKEVGLKETSCENCGGINFDIISESNDPKGHHITIKACKDCGVHKLINN